MEQQTEAEINTLTKDGLKEIIENGKTHIILQLLEIVRLPKKDPSNNDRFKSPFS